MLLCKNRVTDSYIIFISRILDVYDLKRLLIRTVLGLIVLAFGCIGFLFMAQTNERGAGKYSPGYQTASLQVAHRDVFLNLFIWYPTDDDRPTELIGQNALFYGHYVRPNAKPKSGTHPVVVFSHGSGGNALQVGWLAEALAEKGYVVLAANHPGTTSRDSLPERTVMIWERAKDLTEILNWAENPTIEGLSLDTENISVAGFSLGGHSALAISGLQVSKANFIEYCDRNPDIWDCGWLARGGVDFTEINADLYDAHYLDSRVGATIAIDPALAPAAIIESAARITHPVMVINFEPHEGVREALDAAPITEMMPNARYMAIPQSWHFSFLPECSLLGKIVIGLGGEENICSDWKLRDRNDVHQALIHQIIPFLEENLQ